LTKPVFLRRAAELDLVAIEDWYDGQEHGLGREFREAVDAAITRIADNPLAYPERYRGVRRALLRRFPYVLWYRPLDDVVVILACVHGRRDPRAIRARLRGGGE
jgi:plasmid stabilization system protein ParE